MSAVPTPRSVKAIGWSCLAFGGFLLWAAGLALLVRLVLPEALDPAAASPGPGLPLMGWIRAHWTAYIVGQAILGIAHAAVGLGFLKRREWARVSLEAMCWLFLAWTLVSAWLWGVAPRAEGGGDPGRWRPLWLAGGWLFVAAQVAGLALLLYFLRREATRAAFAGTPLRRSP